MTIPPKKQNVICAVLAISARLQAIEKKPSLIAEANLRGDFILYSFFSIKKAGVFQIRHGSPRGLMEQGHQAMRAGVSISLKPPND